MRLSMTFVSEENTDFGMWGWRPKHKMEFDPIGGMGAAHDLLEHFDDDNGSPEHEMMALGALCHVRGDDYFAYKGGIHNNCRKVIASDIIFQHTFMQRNGNVEYRIPPEQYMESWSDEFMDTYMEVMRLKLSELDDEEQEAYASSSNISRAMGWVMFGYEKAQKRYKDISHYTLFEVFREIEEFLEKQIKHVEWYSEVTVNVLFPSGRVTFKENNDIY